MPRKTDGTTATRERWSVTTLAAHGGSVSSPALTAIDLPGAGSGAICGPLSVTPGHGPA
ncbi:hypothetical protein ABZT17_08350 [Streptomyces sp. NPDC005648]|uniref:hypothetical protein n=1 Tax=Streptomyces sp. NPDC005648 TaxID=3157044 RepID=UPI0033A10313